MPIHLRLFLRRFCLPAVLLLCMAVFCACAGNPAENQMENGESGAAPTLTIGADYTILRADKTSKGMPGYDAAISLRREWEDAFGLKLAVKTDFEKGEISDRQAREIVIAPVTQDFAIDWTYIGDLGWRLFVQEERLILAANSHYGYRLAIAALREALTPGTNEAGEAVLTLTLPSPDGVGEDGETVSRRLNSQRLDVADKTDLVAICYSTWFDPILDAAGGGNPPDISRVLAGEEDWGGLYAFHYWGEPALGYYRSTDTAVIRQHMLWLEAAGVDFIIVDDTNAHPFWKDAPSAGSDASYWEKMVSLPTAALLSTMREMRDEGLETPSVAFWCANTGDWGTVDAVLDEFYDIPEYADLFVYWDGKPFFPVTAGGEAREDIVWRTFWGLQGTLAPSEWCFLNVPSPVSYAEDGTAEQVGVCVAAQTSYMSITETAHGRRGGRTFRDAWQVAFDARPKFVTVTWWNEWAAQLFEDGAGNSLFVDNYSEPFSRDIEPMKGGHGDLYYRWLCEYIRAYKAGEACPQNLVEAE